MEESLYVVLREELKKLTPSSSADLDEQQQRLIIKYIRLLHKWNQTYNLTAVRDPEEMIKKHIMDSLSVLPILNKEILLLHKSKQTLVDVGSGAGLPGIPLAIALPQWQFTLIDSNSKKTGFLKHTKAELLLNNVSIVNARVESINQTFDNIICRAFASLSDIIELTKDLWHDETCLWAMKGKYPDEELRRLPKSYRVSTSCALVVPSLDAERHLLKIVKQASTTP